MKTYLKNGAHITHIHFRQKVNKKSNKIRFFAPKPKISTFEITYTPLETLQSRNDKHLNKPRYLM